MYIYLLQDGIEQNSKNMCLCCDIVLARKEESSDVIMNYIWECP